MESSQSIPSHLQIPDRLPIMILTDCYLLPGCYLPLFIFEERYRQMLEHALLTDRMFGIGTRFDGETKILPWTTAAIIRACVRQEDGTSHLMLYGVKRVDIDHWTQEEPFRIAQITPITPLIDDLEKIKQLREEAMSLLPVPTEQCSSAMQMLRTTLDNIPDPDLACDILGYHFVKHPPGIRVLLSEPSLSKRYQAVIDSLQEC